MLQVALNIITLSLTLTPNVDVHILELTRMEFKYTKSVKEILWNHTFLSVVGQLGCQIAQILLYC